MSTAILNLRAKRTRIFFDELAQGRFELTEELIKSEDFLHCYFAAANAALNSHREEKIKAFARLLKSAVSTNLLSSVDEYEEYLSILDDLSVKEMKTLIALESYEARYYKDHRFDSELAQSKSFEGLFAKEVERVFAEPVEDNELKGIVIRLNRTGCYTMMGWRNGPAKDCCLTDLYFRLKALVQNEEGNLI